MVDKKIGMHCSFLNTYVPVHIRYITTYSKEWSCDSSSCGNKKCCLCDSFEGSKAGGRNYLDT